MHLDGFCILPPTDARLVQIYLAEVLIPVVAAPNCHPVVVAAAAVAAHHFSHEGHANVLRSSCCFRERFVHSLMKCTLLVPTYVTSDGYTLARIRIERMTINSNIPTVDIPTASSV
jgi:hypothetical protein